MMAVAYASCRAHPGRASGALVGFEPLGIGSLDEVALPAEYAHQVLFPWGAAVDGSSSALDVDADARAQAAQAGMHHDGIAYFAIDGSSEHGWLVINHEYTDEGLLHRDGVQDWNTPRGAARVAKSKAAHGISVLEIVRKDGAWSIERGRRITAHDEIDIRGPARGDELLRSTGPLGTDGERAGTSVEGTFANCAGGQTPWGTFLACEENFQDYFARTAVAGDPTLERRFQRYDIDPARKFPTGWSSLYGWHAHDLRFDADRSEYHNHSNRFGYVVEIDPEDPSRVPAKRTALGRFNHENAAVVVAPDGRIVVYMGDDRHFEHLYKFVSKHPYVPVQPEDDDAARERKRDDHWKLLDEGTLYVARFDDKLIPESDEREGAWIPLDLRDERIRARFRSEAEVLVFAREAATCVQATQLDRPEWVAVQWDRSTGRVGTAFASLTNNTKRGEPGRASRDAANPRDRNIYGHILTWRETAGDPTRSTFRWSILMQCGWPGHGDPVHSGNVRGPDGRGDHGFGSPDGMFVDPRGVLWVQTDVSMKVARDENHRELGNNQMFAVDPETAEVRRFLVGPRGCEITGVALTPDGTTMFVNVQHPGELPEGFGDPADPCKVSSWPHGGGPDARPRSATLAIAHRRGLPIGS
jgi:secreted PhoX family phosphatase